MNTERPISHDWYHLPMERRNRAQELQDGSLRFEVRSGECFVAALGYWKKTTFGGYVVQYSAFLAAWREQHGVLFYQESRTLSQQGGKQAR